MLSKRVLFTKESNFFARVYSELAGSISTRVPLSAVCTSGGRVSVLCRNSRRIYVYEIHNIKIFSMHFFASRSRCVPFCIIMSDLWVCMMKFLKIALTRTAIFPWICWTGRKKCDTINTNLTRSFHRRESMLD